MVFRSSHKCFTVVSALSDEYSGGKARKEYCKKGDNLMVVSDRDNVLIVFGKNGFFPIHTASTKQVMITGPEDLINRIKEVDLKSAYMFPIEFVLGITENKPWEKEFVEALRKSDVRLSLKNEIIEKYESNSII